MKPPNTVVSVAILIACVGMGSSSVQSAEEPVAPVPLGKAGFPNVYLPLDKLVPKDWKIVGIDTASMPVDTGKPEDAKGLAIYLQGPETVGGLKSQPERVGIWIMPADYKLANPSPDRQAAIFWRFGLSAPGTRSFGSPGKRPPSGGADGDGYMIFFTSVPGVKSWPTWEKDIQDFFGIQQLVPPNRIKQRGTEVSSPPSLLRVIP